MYLCVTSLYFYMHMFRFGQEAQPRLPFNPLRLILLKCRCANRAAARRLISLRDCVCANHFELSIFRSFEREGLQTSGRSVIRFHSIRCPFDKGALAVEALLTHLAVEREACASTHNLPLWTFGPAKTEAASG